MLGRMPEKYRTLAALCCRVAAEEFAKHAKETPELAAQFERQALDAMDLSLAFSNADSFTIHE